MRLFEKALIALIAVLFAALIAVAIRASIDIYRCWKSPTFTLIKTQWVCTETRQVPAVDLIPIGKTFVPVTQLRDECFRYERND